MRNIFHILVETELKVAKAIFEQGKMPVTRSSVFVNAYGILELSEENTIEVMGMLEKELIQPLVEVEIIPRMKMLRFYRFGIDTHGDEPRVVVLFSSQPFSWIYRVLQITTETRAINGCASTTWVRSKPIYFSEHDLASMQAASGKDDAVQPVFTLRAPPTSP